MQSMKGKILVAALVGIIALSAAWLISRVAFEKMLTTVEELSEPNATLEKVNDVFHGIVNLNRLEEVRDFPSTEEESMEVLSQTDQILYDLDSLRNLYAEDDVQTGLIDSVKYLLKRREEVLIEFLDVRKKLADSEFYQDEIALLEEIVANPMTDSLVMTTAHKIVTTIVQPSDTISIESESQNALKEFWKSITRKNKKEIQAEVRKEQKVVEEELSTQIDTLVYAQRDSILDEARQLINTISAGQRSKQERYFEREAELAEIERSFYAQVLSILSSVEQEVIRQNSENTLSAQQVVNRSAANISLIMVVFLVVTIFLLVLILLDISKSNTYRTKLIAAKEEAEFHSLARQRFLSNMSHEIRTPLQSILGFAEQLDDQLAQGMPLKQEDVKSIHHSSLHLLQIVNEVLDFNKISSGNFTFAEAPFKLKEVVNEALLNIKPQAAKKAIDLRLNIVSSLPDMLVGDAFRLKQILLNLLGNAIKFTSSGWVKVEVAGQKRGEGHLVRFSVSDTGIGIPADEFEKIFEYFEQGERTIARDFGGSGLGLSIVKALVEGQNGKVEVKSEPGKGSTFSFELLYKNAPSKAAIPRPRYLEHVHPDAKIWMIEDDTLIAKLCSSILTKHGIEHRVFHSAEDMLYIPRDEDISLILTDIRLPGMSGIELCKKLRNERGAGFKIAAITANGLQVERDEILDAGFDRVLVKPFTTNEFLNLIGDCLEKDTTQPANKNEPTPIQGHSNSRFSALLQMAMGDEAMEKEILSQFADDSTSDSNKLVSAMKAQDDALATELLHRLAGRTAQAGARSTAAGFRQMELAFRSGTVPQNHVDEIGELLSELSVLVSHAQREAMGAH
jgi:signal transduction histidine kinase/CheY-like chemotaxis protein/HPt (histidine-containing phosphotransfer) domain-containing protein